MKFLSAFLLCAALCSAAPKTEVGEINGAKFRIDVPDNWNGSLVMYAHGYSTQPVAYPDAKLNPVLAVFTDEGYALAQSGYAATGWAIQEAVTDIEALRRYFVEKHGIPKETYITGHSMGGFLTMMLMERFPTTYDAGLPLCGPLAPTSYFMARVAFDTRVMFDYYFPGVLPPPDHVPANFMNTPELSAKLKDLMDSHPDKTQAYLRYTGSRNTKDMADSVNFVTYILKDLQQRAGGNPFDNRDMIYESPENADAINDGVKRYTADPKAAEYLRTWYTPTGKIFHPMLAIHTTYDNIVPVRIPDMYPALVDQSNASALFVQQYVHHDGHCNILPQEVRAGFDQLRAWKNGGPAPRPGLNSGMAAGR